MAHPRGAERILAGVDGDAYQPCLGAFNFAGEQLVDVVIRLDEGLLHRVLGQPHVAQIDAAQALEAVAVDLHQMPQSLLAFIFRKGRHRPSTSLLIRRRKRAKISQKGKFFTQ